MLVHEGFAAAAPVYDRLTRLFSFGLDGRWRRRCLDACELRPGDSLLDVATGTGELAIGGATRVSRAGRVIGLDLCREMLFVARRKANDAGQRIAWVQGTAESLPFKDERFDCVTLGFALRHVADLMGTLKEMVRVLKPGGRLGIVEFTRPEGIIVPLLLYAYLSSAVPPLVGLLSRSRLARDLARYLPMTIREFVSSEGLRHRMEAAGLASVTVRLYMAGMVGVCAGVKSVAFRPAPRNHSHSGEA
ncbi:MAG: ubiquinone/menaquinone biosynthesis methyltransferase [Candidatus Methylomirabilales bacterium]